MTIVALPLYHRLICAFIITTICNNELINFNLHYWRCQCHADNEGYSNLEKTKQSLYFWLRGVAEGTNCAYWNYSSYCDYDGL